MSPGLQLPQPYSVPLSVLAVGSQLSHSPVFAPLFNSAFQFTYVSDLPAALAALRAGSFQLVCCSTSFKPIRLLQLLEAVKHASAERLIPLILVVDLNQRVVSFPTSTWAGRFGLVHSQTSPAEWYALLNRLFT